MEVKITGGNLVLKHKLKSNETYKIVEGTKFKSVTIFKKPQIVKGFSNVCEDGKGIIIIDYDNTDKLVVLDDYGYIQERFNLPIGYLFKTKENNFHVVCLKKFEQSKIFEILQHTRCDNMFKSMPLRNPFKSYVLRLSNKKGSKNPKFVEIIGDELNWKYEISSAHLDLLTKLYKKIQGDYEKEDGFKELKIHTYETSI